MYANKIKAQESIESILNTLSQIGEIELPDYKKFVNVGFEFTLEEITTIENEENDPIKYMEKALFIIYFYARKLREKKEQKIEQESKEKT